MAATRMGSPRTILLLIAVSAGPPAAAAPTPGVMERGAVRFAYDERGVSAVGSMHDPFGATVTPGPGRRGRGAATLGLHVAYRLGDESEWRELPTRSDSWDADPQDNRVTYTYAAGEGLRVVETFEAVGAGLNWRIELEATGDAPVRIGDLAIETPIAPPRGGSPDEIFEQGFLSHRFISGHGSFAYFVRASGAPPLMLLTVAPGTKLEYEEGGRGGLRLFVHSRLSGGRVTEGAWRQPHTERELAPGERAAYGFRVQFADSYGALRELLYEGGLFDVRVVPGMTVPEDLTARFSLHTRAQIDAIEAEFPGETTVTSLGESLPDHHVYEVKFRRLGENMLTIRHNGGRETHLEFFVTEPLETLIKKRARFIAERQQIKDPDKWYDGVYGPYDMREQVTRTVDDPDIFIDRMTYVLTCDDPGLCKAPFIAAKNVHFPNQEEIDSLDYYLENFLWGGLQRTGDERPYPYGVYGTPNWRVNRSPERRRAYAESLADSRVALRDLAKEHVWRSYDYPHVVMLYFHMYQIAKRRPGMSQHADAAEYLQRAWRTAEAFYTYPYEIYPSYYDTYKWGLYNELVVLDLIDALEEEGFPEQAEWLRGQWEIKVKYFVYDDEYPFRSEYAFDRTAFESTYAFAKYGATHEMAPDENLWFDLRLKRYYSHPFVRREHSRAFMDRQLAAGLSVRGWLNPAYYRLGCDPGVSYMAAMGGSGILDYGVNFAPRPWDWVQLGYASYLSSWCLMNTGTEETGYGFWYPGEANDGAAGWQFESQKVGGAWMGSSWPGGVQVPRGPWWYDGEIDLGYGGALRMATTLVTNDPVFGWFAYGGAMRVDGERLEVEPRDGLRKRLTVVIPDERLPLPDAVRRFKVELSRDGFAAGEPILLDKPLGRIEFALENRTGDEHTTRVRLSFPEGERYELRLDGRPVELTQTGDWDYPWRAELPVAAARSAVTLVRQESSAP